MHRRIILVLVLLAWLLPGVAVAAGTRTLIVTLKDEKAIKTITNKYEADVIGQIGDEPIYLLQVEDDTELFRKLRLDQSVLDVEEDRIVELAKRGDKASSSGPGAPVHLHQGTVPLFQSMMSLSGDHPKTSFFGTEVLEAYADQEALDLIHAPDVRHLATGAGTRIAFIDTGVDYDHPALRPWLEWGVDLLGGTGTASEFGGVDQSVMSLFEEFVRQGENGKINQSTMSLFWDELRRLGLDQSVMSLFWEALHTLGLDQSTMSLFAEHLQQLYLGQSTMSLFWEELRRLGLDQSVMSLFAEQLVKLGVNQSTMFLFWMGLEELYLNQSTMSLFSDGLREMYLDQSVMSLFGDDVKVWDSFGHGTLVAGLLHACAPEARLVPIRAFDSQGQSTRFLAIAAVYAAIQRGVDVINMSFSIGEDSKAFKKVIDLARSRGIVLVASVGNNSEDAGDVYPAAYPEVIAVAATDLEDRLADFSNFGESISVTAPGVGIVSTFAGSHYAGAPGGLYALVSGTSFSAALVSGSVALLIGLGERATEAADTIIDTADSIEELNPEFLEELVGEGRINLLNALGEEQEGSTKSSKKSSSKSSGKG